MADSQRSKQQKEQKTTNYIFSVPMWDLNFHAEPEKAEGKKKKKEKGHLSFKRH